MTGKQWSVRIFIRISPFYVVGMFSFVVNHEILSSCGSLCNSIVKSVLTLPSPSPPLPSPAPPMAVTKPTTSGGSMWLLGGGNQSFAKRTRYIVLSRGSDVVVLKRRCGWQEQRSEAMFSFRIFRVSVILNSLTKLPTTRAHTTCRLRHHK